MHSNRPLAPVPPEGLTLQVPFGTSVNDALRDAGYDPATRPPPPPPQDSTGSTANSGGAPNRPARAGIGDMVAELTVMVQQAKTMVVDEKGRPKPGVRVQDMRSVMASATALMNSLIKAESVLDANARITMLENAFVHAIHAVEEPYRGQAMAAFEAYVSEHEDA